MWVNPLHEADLVGRAKRQRSPATSGLSDRAATEFSEIAPAGNLANDVSRRAEPSYRRFRQEPG